MKGVEYFFDEQGEPKAVLVDLRENGDLWEDFMDLVECEKRRNDPRVSKEEVEKRLRKLGKIT